MSEGAYVSKIKIERVKGPLRVAHLPGEAQPVYFSLHSEVAQHYGIDMARLGGESHATTIDYVVAGLGGWMLGTFAGALDARKVNAKEGRLTCDVRGEVEPDGKILIIRRVHVSFHLRAENPEEVRETVDRVHNVYAESCPVYRSLRPAFEITSSVELVPETAAAIG